MSRSYDCETVLQILEKRSAAGHCPHFFLCGSSESAREMMAIKISDLLERNRSLPFCGSVKRFTILMPYFNNMEGADHFIAHLKNSLSIAKDCYDRFCGIIMIELDQKWGAYDFGSSLQRVIDHLSKVEHASFILLFPGKAGSQRTTDFFNELSRCGNWMTVTIAEHHPEKCLAEFRKIIEKKGFTLNPDASDALLKILQSRNEQYLDNLAAVRMLADRILFEKDFVADKEKTINTEDISSISGTSERRKTKIGFCK